MARSQSLEIEYHRPPLYRKQEDAIFGPDRIAVIEASTKSGKTFGCSIWLCEQAFSGRAGFNYWWIAPTYYQAKIAYRRLKQDLPDWLYKANDSDLTLTLLTGAILWFKTAEKPDNLYGEDVYAAVLDEASRMREEAWWAVRTTLSATRGPIRIIGNVKGKKNWFFRMARRAEGGEPGRTYSKIIAADAVAAGILEADEVEEARRDLPEAVFNELYLAEPSDDGSNPFGLRYIRACTGPELGEGPVRAWGWDLAKHVDWTVGVGLNLHGQVADFRRWQHVPWEDTIDRIILASGNVTTLVDSTGVGDPVLETLRRKGGTHIEGLTFTNKSKQQLMEGLAVSIQQGELEFPDGVLVNELEMFEYEYTRTGVRYTAPEGAHDDCVMALALANRQLRSVALKPIQIYT